MPQASVELQQAYSKVVLEDTISDGPAMAYLKSAGYKLTKQWTWQLPSPEHKPTENELICIDFLIYEWDFGGIQRETREDRSV